MSGRLAGKVAIVIGAGQTPGDTIGNGRATAILFAREGAEVVVVDRRLDSAEETVRMIQAEGHAAETAAADATVEEEISELIADCARRHGRIDVLHNNVGIGTGDAGPSDMIEEAAWDSILDGQPQRASCWPCKHVLPVMRRAAVPVRSSTISSIAAVCAMPVVARTRPRRRRINAYTHTVAMGNARYGIRANVIMPGLMETPMAIEGLSEALGIPKPKLIEQRHASVPLSAHMGTAWDVAWAAVFLASDEARFVTGVMLPVDGGQSARVG